MSEKDNLNFVKKVISNCYWVIKILLDILCKGYLLVMKCLIKKFWYFCGLIG